MKTAKSFLKFALVCIIIIFPISSNAVGNPEDNPEFDRHISYNDHNKKILKSSIVFLEVYIDENGNVRIENFNTNKPEAADYVVNKINGVKSGNTSFYNEKLILKYYFR
jgi:hypothetical protein